MKKKTRKPFWQFEVPNNTRCTCGASWDPKCPTCGECPMCGEMMDEPTGTRRVGMIDARSLRPALKKKIAELEKSVDDLKKTLAAVIKAQGYAARAANAALYVANYGGRR